MTQNKRIKRQQYPSKYNKPYESHASYMQRDTVWMRYTTKRAKKFSTEYILCPNLSEYLRKGSVAC